MNLKSIKSLIAVAFIQGANFLFPAATLPFLIRYLGPADYGIFNLSQTWAIYFSVIIAYGFDLSATKEVAASGKTSEELSGIFSKVFFSKLYLFVASFIAFSMIVLFNHKLRDNFHVYILMFLWTLNMVFFQSWLYLGLEKQSRVSLFYLISRASSFLTILVLIYFKFSLLVLVLAYSLPQALIGIMSHYLTKKRYGIVLKLISVVEVLSYLKHSFVLFLSTVAGTVTISISVILLGLLSTKESVGYFAVASKLVSLIYGVVLFPFQIVFFPVIVKKVKESYVLGVKYFVRLLFASSALMAFCCAIVYLGSSTIIKLFVGDGFAPSIACLKIVCFVPLFALMDTLFGFLLVALDRRLTYTLILLLGTLTCLILNVIFIPLFNETGSSIAWLVAEVCCFICFFIFLFRKDFSKVYSISALNIKTSKIISFYGSKIYRKRKVS